MRINVQRLVPQYKSIYKTQILDKRLPKHNVRVTTKGDCIDKYLRRHAEVYATSAGARSVGAGVLDEGLEAEGAGAGRIRDMSLGAYTFAFAKNSFISAGHRA
jgi:hypothetical protein